MNCKKTNFFLLGCGLVLSVIFFVFCFFAYPWLMGFIQAGAQVPYVSIGTGEVDEVFRHRLISAFSWGILGIAIGGAAILCNKAGTLKRGLTLFISLAFVAVATMVGGFFFLRYWLAYVAQSLSEELGRAEVGIVLPFDTTRLYEVSFYACVSVLIIAVFIREFNHWQARKVKIAPV